MTPIIRHLLRSLGRIGLVLALTLSAILISIFLDITFSKLLGFTLDVKRDVIMILIIAGLTTPILSWYLVGLFLHVDVMEQKMRHHASIDSLTSVYNRGYFYKKGLLALASKASVKETGSSAFFVLDLDGFKQINDEYGHLCGDRALVSFAQALRSIFHSPSVVARLGGDEFSVLLCNVTKEEVASIAQGILERVRNIILATEQGELNFTASIGIAMFQGQGEQVFERAFQTADKTLYEVKRAGRDGYKIQAVCQ
ncbi:GGDEF domain-containing protein [Marinomonas sp. THO17]|uniref:GGDEF domain-containing protein n=1 Tax=Marinomonas sp. THO17 TaxID=3149048 RepID=UPI00336C1AFB